MKAPATSTRAGRSANVTTATPRVQPGRSADTTGGGAPDKMCGFQRLASRIATLPAAPAGLVPAARIGARSHHARSCSAFSNDSRVRKSPITRQKSRKQRQRGSTAERRRGGACARSRRQPRVRAAAPVRVETPPVAAPVRDRARTRAGSIRARRNRRNRPAAAARRGRETFVADASEDRLVEDEFEPDRHFRRHEDRRRPVRGTRNRAADVGRGRRRHRIPARSAARKSAHRAARRSAAGQSGAAHAAGRPAQAAGKIAHARPRAAARDDDCRRQRRGQDHQHRQARQASAEFRPVGAAGRGRHLPRRRARATDDLGSSATT